MPINTPKILLITAFTFVRIGISAPAQTADALIDKLLEKGILTPAEAKDLRQESSQDATHTYAVKSGVSEWVTALNIQGNFRGRFDGIYSDNPAYVNRDRFRYRLMLGMTALMKGQLEVGVRLGSGDLEGTRDLKSGIDPISSNQSFQNNASKKGVFLDLAYAKWSPIQIPDWSGSLTFGKMMNPFVFSDLVFDHDYTPEGAGLGLTHQFLENHSLTFNAGGFVLDEISASSHDPYLVGAQIRWDAKWSPRLGTSAGVAGMVIGSKENLRNSNVPDINAGNTRTPLPEGALSYNYNPVVVDAAITYQLPHFPFHPSPLPIQLASDYVYNPGAPRRNQAASASIKLGRAGKRGLWEISYRYKYLEGDAWYEEFVDSDFGALYAMSAVGMAFSGYAAGTNIKGHVARASYSPFDAVTLSVTALITELIDPPPLAPDMKSDTDIVRLLVDAQFKF